MQNSKNNSQPNLLHRIYRNPNGGDQQQVALVMIIYVISKGNSQYSPRHCFGVKIRSEGFSCKGCKEETGSCT